MTGIRLKTSWLLLIATAAATVGWGQISTNQSLNGKYFFRQVLLITDGSTSANVTNTMSGEGAITFDGNGNFAVSGQQISGTAAAAALTGSGTYTVSAGGFMTLTNPLKSGVTLNARLGQGAVVGSSTEAGPTVFDIFIAIPAPVGASNSTLLGSYWVSSLEFPGGGLANIRNTNFELTSTGAGTFVETTVTGQAVNLSNILMSQTVSPITYAIAADGSGTLTFPLGAGMTADTQLISGVENIFVAANGVYFIGGSIAAGGHGLVVGIKDYGAGNATNASWNGFYYAAGMRYDTQPARLTAVVGSVHADGAGDSIWARRTKQSDGLFDASPLITYNLNADGSGVWSSAPGHVNVDVDTTTFASSGVDIFNSESYEIYFGALLEPQSGTGVFLNPQGVLNGASFAPPGYPISPGGVMTLFGTGFPATAVTASTLPFGTTLGGVEVSVNGLAAPVYSVSSTQISAIVPFAATGASGLTTGTIVVTVGGVKSNSVVVPLAATSPGIFSFPANGISNAAALHGDYSLVSATNPATQGEVISMYLTGLGATNPVVKDGAAAPGKAPLALITGGLAIYVGGVAVPANQISYAGLAPTLAGLYQVNFMIPNVAAGNVGVAVQTNEGFTDMVYIPIQ
jgi:uncharacterized protein (TIGR03437 family)